MFCFNGKYRGPRDRMCHFMERDDGTGKTHSLYYFSLYQKQRSAVITYMAHAPSATGGGKSNLTSEGSVSIY